MSIPTRENSVTVTENAGTAAGAIVGVSFDAWFEDRAKEIRARLVKMNANAEKAEQHRVSALRILKDVEKRLTVDGKLDAIRFDLFKAKVCPELSTSQAYVKLAILTGKLTLEDHRKKTAARVSKHRKKVAATAAALRTHNGDAIDPGTLGPKAQEQVARLTGSAATELTDAQAKARMADLDRQDNAAIAAAAEAMPVDEPEIPEPVPRHEPPRSPAPSQLPPNAPAEPVRVETAEEKSDRLLKAFKEIEFDAMSDADFGNAKSWFYRYTTDRPKRLAKLRKVAEVRRAA